MDLDDITLNQRVVAGDRRAFSALVARHQRRLRAFLCRVAGAETGDDLAQEAFVRAWQRASQYDGSGGYGAWLARIGWNLFMDDLRRNRRLQRLQDHVAATAPNHLPPHDDRRLDLETAIAALDPAEQAAIVLCEVQGWTHVEAAAILALPLGTLKSVAARGKRKLHDRLVGKGEADER